MVRAVAAASGGVIFFSLASAAYAQADTSSASTTQRLERVEVTGSNIKRIDAVSVSPVQIISREEIQQTGKANVAEVLRNVPQNFGAFDEKNTNSFAPGAAGVSLRGLGQKATLVLINGRRVAGYGFAQNIQETFVDLNSIPTNAVERLEILRDGASAIYGSDAIGGVINVILRKDYEGLDMGVVYYGSSGLNEYRVSGIIGGGNLGSDKFNAFALVDYYHRGDLKFNDRPLPGSLDRRNFQGGTNQTSLTGAGVWQVGTAFTAVSECPGQVLNNASATAAGFNVTGLSGTYCNYDSAPVMTALPDADRIGVYGRATYEFDADMTAYAELGFSHNESSQLFQYAAVRTTGFRTSSAGLLQPFTYRIFLPAGQGGNPTGQRAEWRGFFFGLEPRTTELTSDAYRALLGLQGSHWNWDWDTAITYSQTDTKSTLTGLVSQSGLNAAIAANSYNFDRWTQNSPAVRSQISPTLENTGKSQLTSFDIKASRPFYTLPGGEAAVAIGGQYFDESMTITPASLIKAGDILGRGQTAVDGSRNAEAVFIEFSLPVWKGMELQLAGRYDHYSDVGGKAVPKVGFKWAATDTLLLRTSWGQGFRAPTLPEAAQSQATFFTTINDPVSGQNNLQISGVFSGNPALKPETSTNFIVGLVFEPVRDVSLNVDYYWIKYKNLIASPDFQSIVDNPSAYPPGSVVRDPSLPGNPVVTVYSSYENQEYLKTSGLDFLATARGQTEWATLTGRLNATYILTYDQVLSAGEPPFSFAGNNGPGGGYTVTPRFKLNASVNAQSGPWSGTLLGTYIHSYDQTAGQAQGATWSTGGQLPDSVSARMIWDLTGSWQATKDLAVRAGVLNFTNETPPFDPIRSTTFAYATEEYGIRGRTFLVGLNYKFF